MATDLTFGKRVQQLRQSRGLCPRDFALQVCIKVNYLEKIERDYGSPPSAV